MTSPISRRTFVRATSGLAIGLATSGRASGANEKIILGIIGTGGRGRRLLKALTRIPSFHVAAVCDLIEERMNLAAEICRQYTPRVRKYLDFRRMLDQEKLDACIVATEEGNHAKCVVPVLEAGLHCFSEKPMDVTVEKVDRITRAVRKAKGIYQIGLQRRYVPTFQKTIQHIHEGGVGKVTFLQGMWHWTGGLGGRYLDMDLSGNWFLAQSCHHADVMAWVMNTHPVCCEAMGAITVDRPNPPPHRAEDQSALIFQFPGNVLFSYTHLMDCCEPFTGEKLWVYAEKAGIDLPKGMKYPRPGMGEPERLGEEVPNWDAGTFTELEAFARHIQNNEKPLADVEVGRISTLMGIMAGMAMYNRKKKSYEPRLVTWEDLRSET